MGADVAVLDLRMRRRALIGYSVGMVVYAVVIVALYPSFKNETSLNNFTKNGSTFAALFGAVGSLTSPSGWLNANLYANFVPLVVLLLTIGYGASCIAGQSEDGTLGLIVTMPVSRRRIALEKVAIMALQAVVIAALTGACVAAGRPFDLRVAWSGLAGVTVGVVLLGVVFGALAMLVGAATGSRGSALGITAAVAAASYLVSSLAPVVGWLRPARYASPFYYAVGNGQLVHGFDVGAAVTLCVVALVAIGLMLERFDRLDVR